MPPSPIGSKILIVDDEPVQRVLVTKALALDGHTCVEAESVAMARSFLERAHDFDLVLSDINMPGESGMDLVEWLATSDRHVAVLMATGVDQREVADEAIGLGIHGYLIKPFAANELRIAVANALSRRRLEAELAAKSNELEAEVAARTHELNATATALLDRERRLASLLSSAPVGVLYSDASGRCEYVNEFAAEMVGHEAGTLLDNGFLRTVHPSDVQTVVEHLNHARRTGGTATIEHRLLRPDGREIEAETRIAPVHDGAGTATAFVAVVQDITDQRRFERELAHQATHDDLTGLPNRHLLRDRLEQLLVGGAGTVMLIDLDRFKLINDVHGHTAGDRVLVAVAERLLAEFSTTETVARFGGDEFVVVSAVQSPTDVAEAADRALRALAEIKVGEFQNLAVSASLGVAMVGPRSTPDDLLRGADIAMYRAKERGGGCYELFDEDLGKVIQDRVQLEAELRNAVRQEEFVTLYQPQIDCLSLRLTGVEALVRWQHPVRGLLPPSAFLTVAYELGLMELVTDFVLDDAMQQSLKWGARTPDRGPVPISVNVGALELETGRLRSYVSECLTEHGFQPDRLTLEVTEGALIHDLGRSALRLDAIRSLGVRTALDDFGTGYSSLSYLSRLPLDELKIDRSFVQRIAQQPPPGHGQSHDRQLVQAIIDLAAIFELDVIAEGIEQFQELTQLREMGCRAVQGFLTGRPMSATDPQLVDLICGTAIDEASLHGANRGRRRSALARQTLR